MRYVLVLAIGLLAGWFGHETLVKPPTPRSDPARPVALAPPAPEPVPLPPAPTLPVEEEMVPAEEEEEVPEPPGTGADPLREMLQTQKASWKAMARMQAGQRAEMLLAGLPFDAEREKRIQDLLQKEAELQAERAIAMMLGDAEMDPSAFGWFMGMPAELSPEFEKELATFLNDGEIQVVRAEVKRAHEKQMTDMADMQIGMMSIHDLSDDQKTRMREVFAGKDVMTEQFTRFGEIVRDRDRMKRLMRGEGIKEEMEKGFVATRKRVRDILNNEQYAKYELYEQGMVRQAEMGLKMMSAFLERPREGTQAPASK
jgi:hypothetical protein